MSDELEDRLRQHFAAKRSDHDAQEHALAAYVAGELDPGARASVEAHLESCAHCRELLEAFRQSEGTWESGGEKRGFRLLAWPLWSGLSLAAAAAAALFLVVVPDGEQLAPKGAWSLHVGVRRGEAQFRLGASPLRGGDTLGLFYSAERAGYLAVLYVDEAGAVSTIFPAAGGEAAHVEPARERALPGGLVVDDARGCEWLVGFFGEEPSELDALRERARDMHAGRRGCSLGGGEGAAPGTLVVEITR